MMKQATSKTKSLSLETVFGKPMNPPKSLGGQRTSLGSVKWTRWILRVGLSCNTRGLSMKYFASTEQVVETCSKMKLPVLAVLDSEADLSHTVVIWQGHIIDFESEASYRLSVSNLRMAGGVNHINRGLKEGYVIYPSKAMKKKYQDKVGKYHWEYEELEKMGLFK